MWFGFGVGVSNLIYSQCDILAAKFQFGLGVIQYPYQDLKG
jgi:hypothetical protein